MRLATPMIRLAVIASGLRWMCHSLHSALIWAQTATGSCLRHVFVLLVGLILPGRIITRCAFGWNNDHISPGAG